MYIHKRKCVDGEKCVVCMYMLCFVSEWVLKVPVFTLSPVSVI